MIDIQYPDYNNSIANLACSILKYYGVKPPNGSFTMADKYLEKEYKNVVVLLLDGMGENIINMHLNEDGFFRKNKKCVYSSTFPPTTVAATTAINSGLFPNQSAWLGWVGYFKEVDKNIVYFMNCDGDTGSEIKNINVANTFVPYKSIGKQLKENGIKAYEIASFKDPYPSSYDAFCNEIKKLCDSDGRKYIYAYWEEPDHTMHNIGIDKEQIKEILLDIEDRTRILCEELNDTLFIITADHGHINVRNKVITDYKDISECLLRMPSIEQRALNLFVKKGKKKQFEKAFNDHFGKDFLLMKKSEVLKKGILGIGNDHKCLKDMLGDYLAVAVSDVAIANSWYSTLYAHHAGMTKEEMEIPLIVYAKESIVS